MRAGIAAVVVLAGLAVPAVALADEIRVPGDFRSLQKAVDAARPGDTILVEGGRHRGIIDVGTPGITIEGRGAKVIAPEGAPRSDRGLSPAFNLRASGVTLRGMTLVRGGVFASRDSITIEGCTFLRCDERRVEAYAIQVHGDDARIVGNLVVGGRGQLEGINVRGRDAVVEDNRIQSQRWMRGIAVTGVRARISRNSVSGVESSGGIVVGGDDALLEANEVETLLSWSHGISVRGDRAVLDGNAIDAGESNGASVFVGGSDSVIADSDIAASGGTGIVLWGDRSRLMGNRVNGTVPVLNLQSTFGHGIVARGSGNVLLGNFTMATLADGIRIVGGTGNEVDGCACAGSDACGLLNATGDTAVTGSTFLDNGTDVVNAGSFTAFDGNQFDTGTSEGTDFGGGTTSLDDFGTSRPVIGVD